MDMLCRIGRGLQKPIILRPDTDTSIQIRIDIFGAPGRV